MITEDVENIQRKRVEFQSCITMLNKNIENCCKEGEEKHEILYFLKANWLRKTIQEKENLFTSLDGAIKEREKEICQLKLAVSSLLPLCLLVVDVSI